MAKTAYDENIEHLYNIDARISIHDDIDDSSQTAGGRYFFAFCQLS